MVTKWVSKVLKWSSNGLKWARNCTSFGLNGSHKARNSCAANGPELLPPTGVFKVKSHKELQPITSISSRQNDRNVLPGQELYDRPAKKFLRLFNKV
jgi:hypothetical protein